MSKAVLIRNGDARFLMETDESVEVPAEMALEVSGPKTDIPRGMQPLVNLERIEGDFADIENMIVACSNSLFDAISRIQKPDKVTVEFGIKLAAEAGLPMLTKASGEASFQVSIEWTKSSVS